MEKMVGRFGTVMKKNVYVSVLCLGMILSFSFAQGGDKRWVTTESWSGYGTMNTDVFFVNAAKWRVKYRPEGSIPFYIYVYTPAGERQGRAAVQRPLIDGVRTLRTEKGEKFLRVKAPDAKWQIIVQQHVSVMEEWQLKKYQEEAVDKRTQPVATWTGEDTNRSYEVVFANQPWRITCRNVGDKSFSLKVTPLTGADEAGSSDDNPETDESETEQTESENEQTEKDSGDREEKEQKEQKEAEALINMTTEPGKKQTAWGYESGRYKVTVKASDTAWKFHAREVLSGEEEKRGSSMPVEEVLPEPPGNLEGVSQEGRK